MRTVEAAVAPRRSPERDRAQVRIRRDMDPELRRTLIALALIGLGLLPVGHRIAAWPIMTWPMYSQNTNELPPPVESFVELTVIDGTGTTHRVVSAEIFPMGRSGVARRAITLAFEDTDPASRDLHRRYLASVIQRMPGINDPKVVQGWRLEWDVDPLRVPPLDHAAPRQRAHLGTFDIAALSISERARDD